MSARGRKRRGRRRPGTPRQEAWWNSALFKALGRTMSRRNLLAFRLGPKCGAKRKRDGEPCCNPPVKGSARCRIHGGRVPRGADWHRPQWLKADTPRAEARLNGKLRTTARTARRRDARLEDMTPERRAAYDAWHRAHPPGDPKQRAAARSRRSQDRSAAELIRRLEEAPAPPPSDEERALDELLEKARAELARRAAKPDEGIFS